MKHLALSAILALSLSSCLSGSLANYTGPGAQHEFAVVLLELAEARDAATLPYVAEALDKAEKALEKFLAENTYENRREVTPYNLALMGDAFRQAVDAIDSVEHPAPEMVLARAQMRRLVART